MLKDKDISIKESVLKMLESEGMTDKELAAKIADDFADFFSKLS